MHYFVANRLWPEDLHTMSQVFEVAGLNSGMPWSSYLGAWGSLTSLRSAFSHGKVAMWCLPSHTHPSSIMAEWRQSVGSEEAPGTQLIQGGLAGSYLGILFGAPLCLRSDGQGTQWLQTGMEWGISCSVLFRAICAGWCLVSPNPEPPKQNCCF